MSLSIETKVGLFTLSGAVLFAFGILTLGDVQFHGTYPLYVYFETAEGLPEKGPVKVAGVEVGKVERITLDGARARVKVRVRKDTQVHEGARAHVSSTGLIGSKYLSLTLGDPAAPLLAPGDTLEGIPSLSFDDVMTKLGEFLKDDPETGEVARNLRVTVANFRRVSHALAESLGRREAELTEIVENIRDISASAKRVAADLQDITGERKEDVKIALARFRSVSERLDRILNKVENGEGMLARLLNDPAMGKRLEETMGNVSEATDDMKGFMGRIADIEIYWDYRQRYDMEDARAHADLGLFMSPRPGKFYYLGGNNLGPREDRTVEGNDLEKRNTITGLLGFDFGPLTIAGGAIRSAGGAGLKFRPLPVATGWNRRVELEGEIYDFGRDETIQGFTFDQPVVNLGARVKAIDPWLWIGAQAEDVLERKNFTVNANLNFRDDDLAFLLGLIGLAR